MYKDILKECGWQLPKELLGADAEIYFKDKLGLIHGRIGNEHIRWDASKGLCFSHSYDLVPIEKMWYEYPENFPCCCVYSKLGINKIVTLDVYILDSKCCVELNGDNKIMEYYHINYLRPITEINEITPFLVQKGRIC